MKIWFITILMDCCTKLNNCFQFSTTLFESDLYCYIQSFQAKFSGQKTTAVEGQSNGETNNVPAQTPSAF